MKTILLSLAFTLPALAQTLSIHNPNSDLKEGETSEYSTLETILKENEGAPIVIGVGEAFPQPASRTAHEIFVLKSGSELRALQSATATGTAEALNPTSPLTFSVFATTDPAAAIEMTYDKPEQAGRILWNFHIDKTGKLGKHFYNSYSDTDDGATENLFKAASDSRKPRFDANKARKSLAKYFPSLSKEPVWNQFRNSLAAPELEKTWLGVMKENKWTAAAFVIEGSLMNVNHFRVTKVNKLKPGGNPFAKPKDYRLENNAELSTWTIVGTVVDPQAQNFKELQEAIEAFGQGIHFHGVRSDNKKIGHILTAVLSDKPLKVKMYPLRINSDLGISNNDLIAAKESTGYSIENRGPNFIRNLKYVISKSGRASETREADVVMPHQKITVPLNPGQCLEIDPEKNLAEGGAGRDNNSICAK